MRLRDRPRGLSRRWRPSDRWDRRGRPRALLDRWAPSRPSPSPRRRPLRRLDPWDPSGPWPPELSDLWPLSDRWALPALWVPSGLRAHLKGPSLPQHPSVLSDPWRR